MPILNYTTEVTSQKTTSQIQAMLVAHKAQAVLSEFDTEGVLSAMSFRINTPSGLLTFRLPANVQKIYQVLVRQKIPQRLKTRDQAARVAWRIVKDWIEAQLAMVSAEMVDFEQVFLPYVQTGTGETLYERLVEERFSILMLTNK